MIYMISKNNKRENYNADNLLLPDIIPCFFGIIYQNCVFFII